MRTYDPQIFPMGKGKIKWNMVIYCLMYAPTNLSCFHAWTVSCRESLSRRMQTETRIAFHRVVSMAHMMRARAMKLQNLSGDCTRECGWHVRTEDTPIIVREMKWQLSRLLVGETLLIVWLSWNCRITSFIHLAQNNIHCR